MFFFSHEKAKNRNDYVLSAFHGLVCKICFHKIVPKSFIENQGAERVLTKNIGVLAQVHDQVV